MDQLQVKRWSGSCFIGASQNKIALTWWTGLIMLKKNENEHQKADDPNEWPQWQT